MALCILSFLFQWYINLVTKVQSYSRNLGGSGCENYVSGG